jgi:hypothetical protein
MEGVERSECKEVSSSVLYGGRLVVIGVFGGQFVGGSSGLVAFRDIVIDEGFSVELTDVDSWFLHDETSHDSC